MEYRSISKFFMGILFLPLLLGCDKFLEEVPDDRVELNNLQKASQLLTSAYPSASYNFTEWMSDNVSFTFGTSKQPEHNEAYNWEDVTAIFQDTPTYFWNSSYEAIAHANEVLAVVDGLEGDEERRKAVKGEALLIRAYNHFMLVNLFAEHYNEQAAINALGVPYVEEPEKVFIKQYTRNTIKEVYDNIEKDLLEGLGLVNDNYYNNSGKYHFTRRAALAFASRFYLFKGDYQNCIEYSSRLLGVNAGGFVKDIPALWRERVNDEDYIRLYTSPTDDSNLMLMRKVTNFHVNVGHWPTYDQYDYFRYVNPFSASDARFENAYMRGDNGVHVPKFEFLFERSSLTSNVGLNYTIVLAFRGEEVLLNRAESYVLLNRLGDALDDLNVLIKNRYRYNNGGEIVLNIETLRSYFGVPGNQNQYDQLILLFYILDEKQKEFLHEGLRWFDIKRYDLSVTHLLQDGQSVIELQEDDLRKVLQIPKAAIDVGGLEPNKRQN